MSEPFIAEIKIFAGNFAPPGWVFCDGQLMPISQYTAVFSLVGTTFGGDGETTFGIPDLQGRVPVGEGSGDGLTPRSWGEKGGQHEVTLTAQQIPSHNHQQYFSDEPATATNPGGSLFAEDEKVPRFHAPSNLVRPKDLDDTGGGQPHNNMAPYLALNYIFALQGLYPSRS